MTSASLPQSVAEHWRKISQAPRAGVLAPLFSIYSGQSIGIGEIPDLELLADWCEKTGISIIQILPLNDTGWEFRPYDSQSAFAIDPMYLRLSALHAAAVKIFDEDLKVLAAEFSQPQRFVNYRVKARKLELLWKIFMHTDTQKQHPDFLKFMQNEKEWLDGYAAFKLFKEQNGNRPWWEWPEHLRAYDQRTVENEAAKNADTLLFHKWLAWQAAVQLQTAVERIRRKNILIMADMPFLVSRDSADVWLNPRFFKLDQEAGAPPDLYVQDGQRWGMPPYRWSEIEAQGFRYLKSRIRFLGSYAHLFRIDHFVGLFRLWSIPSSEPLESKGKNGKFDPEDESLWKGQGERIIQAMLEASDMLPCAEDLGVIPRCSYEILKDYQIPGSDVQRWLRHWEGDLKFCAPDEFRGLSIASLDTHDMPSFPLWWQLEAAEAEKADMLEWAGSHAGEAERDFPAFLEKVLARILEARSVFSIQSMQDWLALTGDAEFFNSEHQINRPGKVLPENWSVRLPWKLEDVLALPINATIQRLITNSGRKV